MSSSELPCQAVYDRSLAGPDRAAGSCLMTGAVRRAICVERGFRVRVRHRR
jgi:hypothetical protein